MQCRAESPAAAKTHRRGVTVLELLVVSGVIAILASLLLPAVQGGREAARRAECLSHLRQLAIATEAFVSVNGTYPGLQRYSHPGGPLSPPFSPPMPQPSIHARLLPFLDQLELYQQLDPLDRGWELDEPPSADANAFALQVDVPLFKCPSDRVPAGGNSYRGCFGSTTGMHSTWSRGTPLPGTIDMEGLFGLLRGVTEPRDVRDGFSQTAMFSERIVGDAAVDQYTPFRDLAGLAGWHFYRPNEAVVACAGFPVPDNHYSFLGHTWVLPHYGHTAYNHVLSPNSRIPDCMDSAFRDLFSQGAMTARSMHPGGVNVIFADGAARFMGESIDLPVWRALGSLNGGEVIDDF